MATVKVASLVIRTLAKPISGKLKQQAHEHERFRNFCVNIAQKLHRWETGMRVNLLGENAVQTGGKPHIRALSETKAIATGANFISEAFLFSVAMALILGEGFRSNRKEGKRRDMVADRLDTLEEAVRSIREQQKALLTEVRTNSDRNSDVLQLLGGVIDVEMRNAEMKRILSQDPDIAKALEKLELDQRQVGLDDEHRKAHVAKLERPPEKLLDTSSSEDASKE